MLSCKWYLNPCTNIYNFSALYYIIKSHFITIALTSKTLKLKLRLFIFSGTNLRMHWCKLLFNTNINRDDKNEYITCREERAR